MIKRISGESIPEIAQFIWDVYQDPRTRTTPPYESCENVRNHLMKCMEYDTSDLIGCYIDDKLEGVLLIIVDEPGSYLNIQGPYIPNQSMYSLVATELIEFVESNFKGKKCFVGTTKPNINSQEFFRSRDFKCVDDMIQMSIYKDDLGSMNLQYDIQLLSEDLMDDYRVFHDNQYHDYYWLSERIYDVLDKWKIHVLMDQNQIVGSIFTMKQSEDSGEIYGCKVLDKYRNKRVISELFYVSTKSWMDEGLNTILNFVPEGVESECAEEVGYRGYDTYMCYFKECI